MNYKEIKSFDDACKKLGIEVNLPEVSALPEKHRKSVLAFFMLTIIIQAINDGWEPNWNDYNEWKYYAWFEVEASEDNPAGSGFSRSGYGDSRARTRVGSRLCFKSAAQCDYARKQFADLYRDYLLM